MRSEQSAGKRKQCIREGKRRMFRYFHIIFLGTGTLQVAAYFLKVTLLILILLIVLRLPVYVNVAFCSPPVSGLSSINIFK